MATYGKLNGIQHSLYRYNQLSNAGLKEEANTESGKLNNLINNFNATEEGTIFQGEISNVKYVWRSSPDSCDECQALDGTEYDFVEDIPDKPHPNCNCIIEEVYENDDEESCNCYETVSGWLCDCENLDNEYESASGDADESTNELDSILDYIQNYTNAEIEEIDELQEKLNQLIENAVNELMDIIDQAVTTVQIFNDNYTDLVTLKEYLGEYLDGSAEYYHTKANCEAAQLGDVGEEVATFLGYLREFIDFPKEILFKGRTIKQSFEDSVHDLEVNAEGRKLGKEHPDDDHDVIIPKPDGFPPDF